MHLLDLNILESEWSQFKESLLTRRFEMTAAHRALKQTRDTDNTLENVITLDTDNELKDTKTERRVDNRVVQKKKNLDLRSDLRICFSVGQN